MFWLQRSTCTPPYLELQELRKLTKLQLDQPRSLKRCLLRVFIFTQFRANQSIFLGQGVEIAQRYIYILSHKYSGMKPYENINPKLTCYENVFLINNFKTLISKGLYHNIGRLGVTLGYVLMNSIRKKNAPNRI